MIPEKRYGLTVVLALIAGGIPIGCSKPPPAAPPGKPTVTVSTPIRKMVTEYIEYTGYTTADKSVQLRAQVRGYLDETYFKPRQRVKAGDPLFQIDPRPYQAEVDKAQADLTVAQATYDLSVAKLTRMENSLKANAISEIQVIEQRADRDRAKADIGKAQALLDAAKLNLQYTKIIAPVDGMMGRDLPGKGDLIDPQQTVMATITNDSVVYVYFNVSELDLLRIRASNHDAAREAAGVLPTIPVFLGLANEQGYPHNGLIDYAAPELDRSTGTIELRGRFENPERSLLAGLFARVRVPISEPKSALMVTERAIGMIQGQRFLLVVNSGNKVESRHVKVGPLEGSMRVIEEGIQENDQVIVVGLQRVREGVEVECKRISMEDASRAATKPAEAATQPAKPSSAANSKAGH